MDHKTGGLRHRACAVLVAAGIAAGLSGCEIAGFTLPDLPLPENLSLPELHLPELHLPEVDLPFLDPTVDPDVALEGLSSGSEAVTSPTIREAGTLIVGIDLHNSLAPMVMFATDGAGVIGMDVDLAAALADELGLRVRFVSVDNTDAAVADTVDVVLSTTPADVEAATLVGAYAEDALGFFHKGEATVVDVAALAGARVGVQPGSASKAALEGTTLGMAITDYGTLNDAFAALEAGEVDYVLCDAYAGGYLATGYDDIALAGTFNTPVVRGIAVSSSNSALQQAVQQALSEVQANGVLDAIRLRWVGELPTLTTDQQVANIPLAEEKKDDEPAAEATGTDEDGDAGSDDEG